MPIDLTIKTTAVYRKQTMNARLSQSDNRPYTRHSLKDHQTRSRSMHRAASSTEEIAADILTDLSSLPHMSCKPVNYRRNRRYSELKPSHIQQIQAVHAERRSSASHINFSDLLPNLFRSNRQQRNTTKDETNTTSNTSNSTSSQHNDMMTMKTELPSSLKFSNAATNDLRTNFSTSHDRLSSFLPIDSRSSSISSATSLFVHDLNDNEPRSADTLKLELQTSLCVGETYREQFLEYFHTNYCGEFEREGPFIASVRYFYNKSIISEEISSTVDPNTQCQARAIIRTPNRNDIVSVMVDGANEDNILQILFNQAHLSAIHIFHTIGDPKANEKILAFDRVNDERHNCKIGLIYQSAHQTNEYDIFSNDLISTDLSDFLNILAELVHLKGFTKYRGDLDIKDDLHGPSSYYTQYRNHEIMFNISPMIPSTKANGQCIERKGLVGNSFVCIVFQEPNAEFSPDFISGKVTQIYITVQPVRIDEQVYYKIGIWHRNDMTNRIEPTGGIYRCDNSFRDYFLTLLLNSIHAAIESPILRGRIAEQRQRLKREELKKLSQNLSSGQILNLTADLEQISCHVEQNHQYSRAEHNLSSPTHLTGDSMMPNHGRISPGSTSTKKPGVISKLMHAFSNRSASTIIPPSHSSNHNASLVRSPSPDLHPTHRTTGLAANKEAMRRTASAKGRPAPPPPTAPPVPPRLPISKTPSVASTHSSISIYSIVSDNHGSPHETASSQNLLHSTASEEPLRDRSSSSPGHNTNLTSKHPSSSVSSISEENDNTDSSIGEDLDEEFGAYEHRRTVTESPSFSAKNTDV